MIILRGICLSRSDSRNNAYFCTESDFQLETIPTSQASGLRSDGRYLQHRYRVSLHERAWPFHLSAFRSVAASAYHTYYLMSDPHWLCAADMIMATTTTTRRRLGYNQRAPSPPYSFFPHPNRYSGFAKISHGSTSQATLAALWKLKLHKRACLDCLLININHDPDSHTVVAFVSHPSSERCSVVDEVIAVPRCTVVGHRSN